MWRSRPSLFALPIARAASDIVAARIKAGLYQLHPRLSLRGGKVPVEPKPGMRAQGALKVDQLSLLDAIEDNPELPEAFRKLRKLPDPKKKPPREDKVRARARAEGGQGHHEEDETS